MAKKIIYHDELELKKLFQKKIDDIENIIETMPLKGDTPSDCQRTLLQQKINSFSYAVNGIEYSDLEK